MKYAHMCAHLYVHTQRAVRGLTNKQINFWRYGNLPKRNAKREGRNRVARAKRDRESNQIRQTNALLPLPPPHPLSLSLFVQSQSHAAPHLVVNATIRAVNNVTVSIPHRDLLQNEPVPNQQQQQQLLHRMVQQGGAGGQAWVFVFIIPFPLTSNGTIGSSKQLKSN